MSKAESKLRRNGALIVSLLLVGAIAATAGIAAPAAAHYCTDQSDDDSKDCGPCDSSNNGNHDHGYQYNESDSRESYCTSGECDQSDCDECDGGSCSLYDKLLDQDWIYFKKADS